MRTYLFFGLLTIYSINMYSQEIGFANTKIKTTGAENKVEINFDLTAPSKFRFFDIGAIVNISGTEYNLSDYIGSSVIGVIGPMQVKGQSKFIKWDSRKNLAGFDNMIKVNLSAVPLEKFRTSPYYLKSALLPGWGSGSLKIGKPNKYLAVGSISFLGAGIGFYSFAKNNYSKYQNDYIVNTSDKRYNKVLSNLKLANYCFVGFGVLWISEMINLKITINNRKKSMRKLDNGDFYYPQKALVINNEIFQQINTRTNVEMFIEKGMEYYLSKNFELALVEFNKAYNIEPKNPIIIEKIDNTKEQLFNLELTRHNKLLEELIGKARINFSANIIDSALYYMELVLSYDNSNIEVKSLLTKILKSLDVNESEFTDFNKINLYYDYYQTVELNMSRGNYLNAITYCEKMLKMSTSSKRYFSKVFYHIYLKYSENLNINGVLDIDIILLGLKNLYDKDKYIFLNLCDNLEKLKQTYIYNLDENRIIFVEDRIEFLCN